MDKIYHIIANEIDTDTGEQNEILNDEYEGFTLYGDHGDSFSEIMVNENIMGLASKLAQGSRGKVAVKVASALECLKGTILEDMEDELTDLINGEDRT